MTTMNKISSSTLQVKTNFYNDQNLLDMDDDTSSHPLFILDHVGDKNVKERFEEKEDESDKESTNTKIYKVEDNDDDDDKNISTDKKLYLPRPNFDENQNAEKTKQPKKEKEEENSQYSLSTSIDTHLNELLAKKYKHETGIDKIFKSIKPAADPNSEIMTERKKKKLNKQIRDKVCSSKWFNMKAPELTKDVKNQLSILRMREILDRKNFYKSNDRKKFPKFFQMGKVVESPADFYHARIPKKQRKSTLLGEIMADADLKRYQKRKYAEVFGNAKKTKYKKKRKPSKN